MVNGFPKIFFSLSYNGSLYVVCIFNDRFYLSFFVATHGFRESDFDYYSISYLSARTKVDPMFQCVYISKPLKSRPYKSSATCAWSMARVAEKPALIYVRTTKAQLSLRVRAGGSAPLLFAIARFFFYEEASHKLKWRTEWYREFISFS